MDIKQTLETEPLSVSQYVTVMLGAAGGEYISEKVAKDETDESRNRNLTVDLGLGLVNILLSTYGRAKLTGNARTAAGYASAATTGMQASRAGKQIKAAVE